ncbi:right-handed parallel beta-helix repeat-containing protein [Geomonas ferrireducens]|uniref:hypothetical protein n=1 Tax=Geomonas ferrireducens TaxID=2570227 RepID=UPI0010A77CF2|nr:hypothetical protein [Geomonas ferrireducens]
MRKIALILFLVMFTSGGAFAAPSNTSGPWGIDAAGFQDLSTALASPSTVGKTIVISKPMTINSMTVSGSRAVKVIAGGRIDIAAGKTLTFSSDSSFLADNHSAFGGTGTVTFSSGSVNEVRPEWWGAASGTESAPAIQAAITAAEGTTAYVRLSGFYTVSKQITVTKTIRIVGAGMNSGIYNLTGANSSALYFNGSAWPGCNRSVLSNFKIEGNGTTSGHGIWVHNSAAWMHFENVYLTGNHHGYYCDGTDGTAFSQRFVNCYAKANYGNGFYENTTGNPNPASEFIHCQAESNVIGIEWSSSQLNIIGGVYETNVINEMYLHGTATLMGVYFEESKGPVGYGNNAMLRVAGYGTVVSGCKFAINATQNIRCIHYESFTIVENNAFNGSTPAGSIGIYNGSRGQIYTGSRILANISNAVATYSSLGTAETTFADISGNYTFPSVTSKGAVTAATHILMNGTLTNGTPGTNNGNQIKMGMCPAGSAANYSIFVDSADGKLKYKDGGGVVNLLY